MARQQAYDRVKNTDNRADVFIKTAYWTPEVEDHFEAWLKAGGKEDLSDLLDGFLGSGVAVSFKSLDGSICCTLAHQASREANLPYLLTGWSDNADDALAVAAYKLEVQLNGIWEAPPAPKVSRRR